MTHEFRQKTNEDEDDVLKLSQREPGIAIVPTSTFCMAVVRSPPPLSTHAAICHVTLTTGGAADMELAAATKSCGVE